ncbi:MAG TPA: hypothetical protein VGO07_04330 [Candidatus Saccharimonadales bacterium]|jgi:hypothetical protein|nr:hypothetical protein [Candidatus Saccharimonadales bacterium]
MKKLFILPLVLATLTVGWVASTTSRATADSNVSVNNKSDDIVGTWDVQAIGAPYEPHLFTFNSDGTMNTTNPTNVQENPAKPHGGTNDSLGMGPWEPLKGKSDTFIGTFYELNANADDHTRTDRLQVTYKVTVHGDTFSGKALARQGSFSAPAQLEGTRLKIVKSDLNGL